MLSFINWKFWIWTQLITNGHNHNNFLKEFIWFIMVGTLVSFLRKILRSIKINNFFLFSKEYSLIAKAWREKIMLRCLLDGIRFQFGKSYEYKYKILQKICFIKSENFDSSTIVLHYWTCRSPTKIIPL